MVLVMVTAHLLHSILIVSWPEPIFEDKAMLRASRDCQILLDSYVQAKSDTILPRACLKKPNTKLAVLLLLCATLMSCGRDNVNQVDSTQTNAANNRLDTLVQREQQPKSVQATSLDLDALLASIPEDATPLRERLQRELEVGFIWQERTEGKIMVVQMGFQRNLQDRDLVALAGLAGPLDIHLTNTPVSNQGLALLARLRQHQGRVGLGEVWGLSLGYTKISDEGLVHLAAFDSLRALDLSRTDISDNGLAHLAKLVKLQQLVLAGTKVQGPGLRELRALAALQELDLDRTPLQDEGLHQLPVLPNLRKLVLRGTPITDAGLARLKELPGLEELDVTNTRITDACVRYLTELRKLRRLRIVDNTGFTERGAIQLRLALPDTAVID